MPDGYVTVARFVAPLDAEMARIKLEGDDIPVFLVDTYTTGINPIWGGAIGIRLQVPSERAQEAAKRLIPGGRDEELLELTFDGEYSDGDEYEPLTDFSTSQSECPKCHCKKLRRNLWGQKSNSILFFLFLMFFGVHCAIFPATKRRFDWICKECQHTFRAP